MTARPPPVLQALVEQVLASAPSPLIKPPRFNPRPPGVIRPGSTTDAVIRHLRAHGGFQSHCQIVWATKRSGKAVDWALLFLRSQKLVRAVEDTSRNSRYLRYVAIPQSKSRSD